MHIHTVTNAIIDRYPTPSETLSGIPELYAPSYVALDHHAFPILMLSLTFDTAAVIPNVGDIMISSHNSAVSEVRLCRSSNASCMARVRHHMG